MVGRAVLGDPPRYSSAASGRVATWGAAILAAYFHTPRRPRRFPPAEAAIWYNFRVMLKQSFRDFIFSTNTDGSGKAASYVRALDMLGPILTRHYPRPIIRGTMWQRFSIADIQAIHKWICAETKKGVASPAVAAFASPRDMSICSIQKAIDDEGGPVKNWK